MLLSMHCTCFLHPPLCTERCLKRRSSVVKITAMCAWPDSMRIYTRNFWEKPYNQLKGIIIRAMGSTIIIVSHNMSTLRSFCDRALWIDLGHMKAIGNVNEVIEQYTC